MTQPMPTKPGSVGITKVGHTFDGKFGQNPNAQEKGKTSATPITFGKGT